MAEESQPIKQPKVGRYSKVREVGIGSYGKAILVEDSSKRSYIMKVINITRLTAQERKDAVQEVKLLSSMKHPCITQFRESFLHRGTLCIVMDFAEEGDLFKRVVAQKKSGRYFAESQVSRWLTEALLGLAHLHDKKILHRDIKSKNMFISKGALRIGDFGIAKVLENTGAFAKTTIGTPYYLSPEICKSKPYSWASDVWALGCVAYEMCALRVPFDAPNLKLLVEKITTGQLEPLPDHYSKAIKDCIVKMLTVDYEKRPTVRTLLKLPCISAELELMRKEAIKTWKMSTSNSNIQANAAALIAAISVIDGIPSNKEKPTSPSSTMADSINSRSLTPTETSAYSSNSFAETDQEGSTNISNDQIKYLSIQTEPSKSNYNDFEHKKKPNSADFPSCKEIKEAADEESKEVILKNKKKSKKYQFGFKITK